ncbi:MAG: flagellar basal body P-ring formation chaperone FlgA [Sphingobium sp.]|jgi:flagella basal body P-ring formation protein FlgA|nr:flagellar basal body P-ring formation chaperone FlgA [Sphingobium sp.]MCI1271336.1 flagellar basal body P-ring formation chaperone FlgA [Sphingobium sp.]MCI1756849.1 flagellar basal body P-ring formation chaperone FlgA [Sphingobium sp.]MCI2053969.1 flagellar basal body P-ring formation chaperone FlgA [Sphingobium sp.]
MIALLALAAAASGGTEADVLVRPVARGEILRQDDFTRQGMSPAAARYALRAEEAAGKEAKRALPVGIALRASDIGPPTLIRRGDAITLLFRDGRLTISAPGKALSAGSAGAPIRIVNLASDRTLDARVLAAGTAEVTP